jgi:hypothetical protein
MLFFKHIMRHRKVLQWEQQLKAVFDEIDAVLENDYGGMFPLHPSRVAEGKTSNPESDGLFNVGASYSAGYGSRFGPGYVVDIKISTLQHVPKKLKTALRDHVQALLIEKLPAAFPGKELHVDQELNHLRIHGDLSLN